MLIMTLMFFKKMMENLVFQFTPKRKDDKVFSIFTCVGVYSCIEMTFIVLSNF